MTIIPSGFFGSAYASVHSMPRLPLADLEGVPVLFGEPRMERKGDNIIVHADLVASTYFLVTRYEEWVRREVRDPFGRFPGRESLPFRAGFIDRPIVNEYGALIRRWLRESGVNAREPRRRFRVLLTHDCDQIHRRRGLVGAVFALGGSALGRRSFGCGLKLAGNACGLGRDPLDNLEDVIALDSIVTAGRDPAAASSIYFFMSGGRSKFDGNYSIRSRTARRWISGVLRSGAEIGLHASYEAGQTPKLLRAERKTLEDVVGMPIAKNRHHFLSLREPEDAHQLAAAGVRWDTTLGYADVAGFRLGVCTPISLFCPARQQPLGIEEHPLVVMDSTLSHPCYMGLDEEEAFAYCRRLADTTCAHGGEFVALWHNTTLASTHPTYPYHARLYRRLLRYLAELLDFAPETSASCRQTGFEQ